MVQSDDDLVIEVPVARISQQEHHADHGQGAKERQANFHAANYLRDGNTLWVVSWRNRNWWKNLRGGAKVQVLLAGKSVDGCGQVIEEQKPVAQSLFEYYCKVPQVAKYV